MSRKKLALTSSFYMPYLPLFSRTFAVNHSPENKLSSFEKPLPNWYVRVSALSSKNKCSPLSSMYYLLFPDSVTSVSVKSTGLTDIWKEIKKGQGTIVVLGMTKLKPSTMIQVLSCSELLARLRSMVGRHSSVSSYSRILSLACNIVPDI